jgi:hypothetical protein
MAYDKATGTPHGQRDATAQDALADPAVPDSVKDAIRDGDGGRFDDRANDAADKRQQQEEAFRQQKMASEKGTGEPVNYKDVNELLNNSDESWENKRDVATGRGSTHDDEATAAADERQQQEEAFRQAKMADEKATGRPNGYKDANEVLNEDGESAEVKDAIATGRGNALDDNANAAADARQQQQEAAREAQMTRERDTGAPSPDAPAQD